MQAEFVIVSKEEMEKLFDDSGSFYKDCTLFLAEFARCQQKNQLPSDKITVYLNKKPKGRFSEETLGYKGIVFDGQQASYKTKKGSEIHYPFWYCEEIKSIALRKGRKACPVRELYDEYFGVDMCLVDRALKEGFIDGYTLDVLSQFPVSAGYVVPQCRIGMLGLDKKDIEKIESLVNDGIEFIIVPATQYLRRPLILDKL
jgi:hypothetical protein